jgi:hypothetical protein
MRKQKSPSQPDQPDGVGLPMRLAAKPAGERLMTTGRFAVEPKWPMGGAMITRPIDERNYDVQWPTGYAVSTVPSGSWSRGQIVRQFQPNIHPPMLGYFAYDPTDPTTWNGNVN